jgi:hypothetical protein
MYFGPANSLGAPMRGTCNLAGTDLNGDGLPDVLCNFDPRTLDGFFGIPNQSEVEASFVTTDGVGTLFRGSVTIRIVGN